MVRKHSLRKQSSSGVVVETMENRQLFAAGGLSFHLFPQINQNTNFIQNLTAGADGNIYFSSGLANNVASISPAGTVKVYDTTSIAPHGPNGVAAGPGGIYLNSGNNFGEVALPSGKVTDIPISQGVSGRMTLGPDGNFWVGNGGVIEQVQLNGLVTRYQFSGNGAGQIVSWNGQLYFTSGNFIRRISTGGSFDGNYQINSSTSANVEALTVGPDGNLWFTEQVNINNNTTNYFGYLTSSGAIKTFQSIVGPVNGIAAGGDGNIYFRAADYLVGATTKGTIFATQNLGQGSNTDGKELVEAPNGNLWFNENFNDKMGVVYVASTLSGKVTGSNSAPIAGVTVFLDVNHTGSFAAGDPTATTSPNGIFSFNVAPGAYTVGVVAPTGYKITSAAEVKVTVALNAVATANFTLAASTAIPTIGLNTIDGQAALIPGGPTSTGVVLVSREAGAGGAVAVQLSVGGTAVYGVNYKISVFGGSFTYNATTKTLSITIAANAAQAALVVTPLSVGATTAQQTVTFGLLSNVAYVEDLAKLNSTVTIAAY